MSDQLFRWPMLLLVPPLVGCGPAYDVSAPTVPMPDGTQLAVDVILPAGPARPVPAVLIQTRYWRSFELKFRRGPGAMPIQPREDVAAALVEAGYAVVLADVRGTGASEGTWRRPWSEAEVQDMGTLIDWIVAQPWSDGRVGTEGVSYEGTTALLAATQRRTALRAALAREIEWDLVDELLAPGGVRNTAFVAEWGRAVADLDRGAVPAFFPSGAGWMIRGPRRVDADPDGVALADRLAGRTIPDVAADVAGIHSPTDPWGDGTPASEVGPSAWADALAASPTALGVWGSWWDAATAEAVLRADGAVRLVDARIGGWTHEGDASASPLGAGPDVEVDLHDVVAFFDVWLRGDGRTPVRRWYVAGAEAWESGADWPTTAPQTWGLRQDGTLGAVDPELRRTLTVDFAASVGEHTRWSTGLLTPVDAPDRAHAPGLVSFATPPLPRLRAFGAPRFACDLALAAPEAALHVYLEAIEPDGEVRLLTEGVRRVRSGPVEVPLRPVAFALEPGWALRLSVAGADAGTFERVPAVGDQAITLTGPCSIEVPSNLR